MKINNVEKFREELYKALKDNYYGEISSCMWKDGNEHNNEMEEEIQYRWNPLEGRAEAVSLPQTMYFRDYKVAITVDEDGVMFWDGSLAGYFDCLGYESILCYRNKMSFVIGVTRRLETLAAETEERLAKITGAKFNVGDKVRIVVHEEDTPSLGALEHNGEVVTIKNYVEWCGSYRLEELDNLWSEELFERA